jgi:beta-glucosidase
MGILNDPARTDARLGFLGDSITQMWPDDLLAQKFSEYKPIRMGIGGDRTQTLLWRIGNGELKGMSLETVVLLIGTNNLGAGDSPKEVVKGIKFTIDQIRIYQPRARIILMAILPREQSPGDPLRLKVQETNELLAASAKEWNVDLLDIGPQLVEKDGSISKEIMDDFVHITPKGYQIWADAVIALMKKDKV